jgi:putative ABC transport system ATP-binding protein
MMKPLAKRSGKRYILRSMEGNSAAGDTPVLAADRLTRSIRAEGQPRTIIDSFSFSFERGQMYTVVGPSGSGKTSLLRLLNRLDEKSGGTVLFAGRPIEEYAVTELRRKVALVFQIPHMFPGTVASNLTYCCQEKSPDATAFAAKYLSLVGLDAEFAGRDPEKLSVGQKQRVALARSLVQEPEVLLLDEPTSALDPGAARTVEDLIIQLNRDLRLTIIMVTHNFKHALALDGISLLLIDGRLVDHGPSRDIFDRPANDMTRRFLNGDLR